jgi:hypothetical protein
MSCLSDYGSTPLTLSSSSPQNAGENKMLGSIFPETKFNMN